MRRFSPDSYSVMLQLHTLEPGNPLRPELPVIPREP